MIRQVIAGKRTIPEASDLKLVYAVNIARLQQQDAQQGKTATPAPAADGAPPSVSPAEEQARAIADRLLAMPKNERLAALEALPPEQLVVPKPAARRPARPPGERFQSSGERFSARLPAHQVWTASELQQAKVMRAIYSERQLSGSDDRLLVQSLMYFKTKIRMYTTAYRQRR